MPTSLPPLPPRGRSGTRGDPEVAHAYARAVDHAGITAAPLHLVGHVIASGLPTRGRGGR
ncbi:hypothetical protein ABZ791_01770 [Streptomyces huasconensis]|uniref:Uncharacterized protein n=1 Tax=Streptomyces huasconensis TaxID=1854574 RepID=A0ABV3LRT3_9ACTN